MKAKHQASFSLQRGRPSRMALAYAGEKYEDECYNFGAQAGAKDHWPSQKFNLGLPFPNLPYYIDGNVCLTQSSAVLKHIGRKHGLCGKCPADEAQVDMLLDTVADCFSSMGKVVFNPDCVRLKLS